jgi:DNA anti-recombination protein RmuC
MKISVITTTAAFLMMGVLFSNCSGPTEKVKKAEEKAAKANEELIQENEAYVKEMEEYRKTTAEQIAANEKSLEEFNTRIAKEKGEAKAEYQKEIEELNKKNSDMKRKMAEFKTDNKTNWETFKIEFSRDMDELGTAFKNFTVKDKNKQKK